MAKGANGKPGYLFDDFRQGDTLPFTFYFKDTDNITPIDVTGWKVYISYTKFPSRNLTSPDLEITLLPQDAVNGIISGEVSDSDTLALAPGAYIGVILYIKSDGRTYSIDSARLDVFPAANPRVEQ